MLLALKQSVHFHRITLYTSMCQYPSRRHATCCVCMHVYLHAKCIRVITSSSSLSTVVAPRYASYGNVMRGWAKEFRKFPTKSVSSSVYMKLATCLLNRRISWACRRYSFLFTMHIYTIRQTVKSDFWNNKRRTLYIILKGYI